MGPLGPSREVTLPPSWASLLLARKLVSQAVTIHPRSWLKHADQDDRFTGGLTPPEGHRYDIPDTF